MENQEKCMLVRRSFWFPEQIGNFYKFIETDVSLYVQILQNQTTMLCFRAKKDQLEDAKSAEEGELAAEQDDPDEYVLSVLFCCTCSCCLCFIYVC